MHKSFKICGSARIVCEFVPIAARSTYFSGFVHASVDFSRSPGQHPIGCSSGAPKSTLACTNPTKHVDQLALCVNSSQLRLDPHIFQVLCMPVWILVAHRYNTKRLVWWRTKIHASMHKSFKICGSCRRDT